MSEEDKQPTVTTDPLVEVKAMASVAESLAGLDADAVGRVLRWAVDRFGVTTSVKTTNVTGGGGVRVGGSATVEMQHTNNGNGGTVPKFESFADLYGAANPESEADKALVAGYWFQFVEGKPEFGAQELNTALKNLGHPIANITTAFDNLKARRPAPVLQLKKAGTSKQARKTYKLTHTGRLQVDAMVGQQQ